MNQPYCGTGIRDTDPFHVNLRRLLETWDYSRARCPKVAQC
jgi:hypothetical protein